MWFSFTLKEEREKEAEKEGGGENELEKEEDAQEVARLHIRDLINSRSLLLQSLLPVSTSPLPLPPPLFPSLFLPLYSLPSALPIWAMRSCRLCLGSVVSFLTMNWCDYAGLSCTLGWIRPPLPTPAPSQKLAKDTGKLIQL